MNGIINMGIILLLKGYKGGDSMLVKCDGGNSCGGEFTITGFEVKKLENDIEKTYFKCPYCDKEFIAFYTNSMIRKKQEKMRKLQEQNKRAVKLKLKNMTANYIKQMDKLQKEIGRDMESLRKTIEAPNE